MNITKEIKFFGVVVFAIFCIVLLFGLISLITIVRFRCKNFINYIDNIKIEGNITNYMHTLKTGDIVLFGEKVEEFNKNFIQNKINCFYESRKNFTPNNYLYTHIGIIYRKNNIIYIIESESYGVYCTKKESLVKKNYNGGPRIVRFDKSIKQYEKNCKKNKNCCVFYGIRSINPKFSQKELNRRLENEFNILSNTGFPERSTMRNIASPGWLISDFPLNIKYGIVSLFPEDNKDSLFCSEIVALLLQRIGVMKRTYPPRLFFPAYFTGYLDNKIFPKNTYSKIKIYK